MHLLICFLILSQYTFSLDIDEKTTFTELLSHAEIYIDENRSSTIENIQDKSFKSNTENILGFGYSPNFNVWIKFTLTNTSEKTIQKIVEYDNPLTSYIKFFDADTQVLLKEEGLFTSSKSKNSIHPIFKITLNPKESKTFYIQVSSKITTLIVKLNLWSNDAFYKKELHYQFILALFFGAMSIIIIYNFIIYLSTRQMSYLYYVLAFIGITFHHLIYKGVASLYLFPAETIAKLVEFSSFIVAVPVFFLALFTKTILDLQQYPQIHRILKYYLLAFPLLIVLVYGLDLNQYRSLFSVILLFALFLITLYALFKENRQARFIMLGWTLFFTSGLFMYLSSLGIYDIFSSFPHYTELSLVAESLIFSFSLADKIKQLQKEKLTIEKEKHTIQKYFIFYQKKEKNRLAKLVKEKTKNLQKSLGEKELLLKELNHRVKNSIDTIVSFLRLQIDETEEIKTQKLLIDLENRIMVINHLYALLHTKYDLSFINTYEYFSLLLDGLQTIFQRDDIQIDIHTDIDMKSDYVLYCGFILNEAITNAFQHAFTNKEVGTIFIGFSKNNDTYHLIIKDNGIGYNKDMTTNTLGLIIIKTLVVDQLGGELTTHTHNGVEIDIRWRDDEK